MIPKLAHTIWMQGADKIPADYKSNLLETQKLNPDWKILIWDRNSIREELKKLGDKYLQKFDSFHILHQKVDFARYALIYIHGGLSIDADAKAIKPFSEIPYIDEKNFIVGYSNMDKVSTAVHGYENRTINNSVIIASPRHPVLKDVLDHILTLDCRPSDSDFSCVIFTTGQSFNEVLYKHKNEITILPNEYFEACHSSDSGCELPPTAIIEHRHAQTWVPKTHQLAAKAYFFIKQYWFFILFLIVILFLALRKK